MGTSVVVRDHFDVFVTVTSIELILDAEIGEVHRLVEVRQVMFPRPLLDLPRIAIGPPITVWAVPVVLLQELLVLTPQVPFQDDASIPPPSSRSRFSTFR